MKSKDRNIIQPAHFAKETTPDSSSADTAGSIPAASTEPSDLSSSSSSSCKSTDMVKEKPNSTRIYDEEGFRRRAACICVKSEDENEVWETPYRYSEFMKVKCNKKNNGGIDYN